MKKASERVVFWAAMAVFLLGMFIVWFGTNEKMLKLVSHPKVVEYTSLGLGSSMLVIAAWLIFKFIGQEPIPHSSKE